MLKEEGCVFLASSDGKPSVRSMLECALEETAPKAALQQGRSSWPISMRFDTEGVAHCAASLPICWAGNN